jgi:hypothetical protein
MLLAGNQEMALGFSVVLAWLWVLAEEIVSWEGVPQLSLKLMAANLQIHIQAPVLDLVLEEPQAWDLLLQIREQQVSQGLQYSQNIFGMSKD